MMFQVRGAKCEVPSIRWQMSGARYEERPAAQGIMHPAPRTPHPALPTSHLAPRTYRGFTLLELLISMTILTLIFVAILGAIRIGSKSWEGGEQRAEENQRTRTLFDSLARELTMLYPLRIPAQDTTKDVIVFRGKSDSLEFATLPQSYGAAPFSHMIRIVRYSVESDQGLMSTESYPLVGLATAFATQEGRVKGLDERVTEARFRYLVPEGRPEENLPAQWRDSWDPSQDQQVIGIGLTAVPGLPQTTPSLTTGSSGGKRQLQGSDRLPMAVEITMRIRQARQQGIRELILPPLVFPVQVGRTL